MTTPREFRPGDVIAYPYLWKWQSARGETEGRKTRPVCVVIAVANPRDGLTHLAMLAISSSPPVAEGMALEVPEIECRRAGLSDLKRAWVSINEYNYDIAEHSFYLEAQPEPSGRFSKPFMMRLAAAFAPLFSQRKGRVDRTE